MNKATDFSVALDENQLLHIGKLLLSAVGNFAIRNENRSGGAFSPRGRTKQGAPEAQSAVQRDYAPAQGQRKSSFLQYFQHRPFFIARAGSEVAESFGSCVWACKAPAFSFDGEAFKQDGGAVEIRVSRAKPILAGSAQFTVSVHQMLHTVTFLSTFIKLYHIDCDLEIAKMQFDKKAGLLPNREASLLLLTISHQRKYRYYERS